MSISLDVKHFEEVINKINKHIEENYESQDWSPSSQAHRTVYLGRRPATRLKGKCEERLTKDCEDYSIFDLLV